MKTPMQNVIDKIKELDEVSLELFMLLTPILSKGLDEEKEVIIHTYLVSHPEVIPDFEGENYYNENFS